MNITSVIDTTSSLFFNDYPYQLILDKDNPECKVQVYFNKNDIVEFELDLELCGLDNKIHIAIYACHALTRDRLIRMTLPMQVNDDYESLIKGLQNALTLAKTRFCPLTCDLSEINPRVISYRRAQDIFKLLLSNHPYKRSSRNPLILESKYQDWPDITYELDKARFSIDTTHYVSVDWNLSDNEIAESLLKRYFEVLKKSKRDELREIHNLSQISGEGLQ